MVSCSGKSDLKKETMILCTSNIFIPLLKSNINQSSLHYHIARSYCWKDLRRGKLLATEVRVTKNDNDFITLAKLFKEI